MAECILLEFQEVSEQVFPDGRQNRFRMELDPFDTQRLMTDSHDLTFGGLGGNLATLRESTSIDDKGMIARRVEGIGQRLKDGLAVVLDLRRLSMHQTRSANDFSSVGNGHRLMPQAHAENGQLPPEPTDRVD